MRTSPDAKCRASLIVWDTPADFAEPRRHSGCNDAVGAFFTQIEEVVSSEEGTLWE